MLECHADAAIGRTQSVDIQAPNLKKDESTAGGAGVRGHASGGVRCDACDVVRGSKVGEPRRWSRYSGRELVEATALLPRP